MSHQAVGFAASSAGLRRRMLLGGSLSLLASKGLPSQARAAEFRTTNLGNAWTGADLHYAAEGADDFTHVAYLDPARRPTVGCLDHRTGAAQSHAFGTPCDGFDPHREVKIFRDGEGTLHIAGFMHADGLRYARLKRGDTVDRIQALDRMTGRYEDAVTYPRFLALPGNRILFTYRFGRSGAGETRVKVFKDGAWHDNGDGALLGSTNTKSHSSAYPYDPVVGPDGLVHLVWSWRRTADVATNYDIGYAKSSDLSVWYDATGKRLETPILPGSSAVIDPVGENRGLMGPPRIGFDRAGRPLVTYLKFDAQGATQVFLAQWRADTWSIKPITHWTYHWDLHGYGTVLPIISTLPLQQTADGNYILEYNHQKEGKHCRLTLDADLREIGCDVGPRPPASAALPSRTDVPRGFQEHRLSVPGGSTRSVLSWVYQPIVGDVRPACTSNSPMACDPPPLPLLLYTA